MKSGLPLLLWRAGAALLALAILGMVAVILLSGGSETKQSMESGRRLLVRLDNGAITGKQISTTAPAQTPADTTSAPTPAEPAPATPAPDAQSAAPASAPEEPQNEAPKVDEHKTEAAPADTALSESALVLAPALPTSASDNTPAPTATHPLSEADPALLEKTDIGMLPIIGPDGTKPWRHYAKPFSRSGSAPIIAIIISGLGESKTASDAALKMPENFTLSFSPYAKNLASWGAAARATGHEALIDLPMEPSNYPVSDPGPYGLLVQKGPQENDARLQWAISRLPGTIGMLMPQDEAFSANDEAFRLLLQSLANRGLLLVISREPAREETKQLIGNVHTANAIADVWLDEDLSVDVIRSRLATLEQQAKQHGSAVAIASDLPVTLEQLREWSRTLAAKGIVLAPVSAVASLRFS